MARTATTILTLLILFCALAVAAGEPATAPPDVPPAPPVIADLPENAAEIADHAAGRLVLEPVVETPPPAAAAAVEMQEIDEALAACRARVADLTARLRETTADETALALQRDIEQSKRETELDVLRIQAKHARLAGRDAQADAIEAELARMTAPAVPTAPAAAAAR